MKIIVSGLIALLIGIAAGTYLAPGQLPSETEKAPVTSDSVREVTPSPPAPEEITPAEPAGNSGDQGNSALRGTGESEGGFDAARYARIISILPVADAVVILAPLPDDQVELVLRKLGKENLIAIVAALPEARGSLISRRLLLPGRF